MSRVPTAAVIDALGRWLLFVVVIALVPILFNFLGGVTAANGHLSFTSLFGHGEVLIVTCAVLGAGINELFARDIRADLKRRRTWIGCWSGLVLLVCAAWFAVIQADVRDQTGLNYHRIAVWSVCAFVVAAISSGTCVTVSQFEEPR
jgi:hypothetical protein